MLSRSFRVAVSGLTIGSLVAIASLPLQAADDAAGAPSGAATTNSQSSASAQITPADSTSAAVTNSTATAGQPQAMSAVITEVHGLVQYRESDTDTWHAAKADMQISQGGELRTGPHSAVTCVIPPDQQFTLDRLGTVRVAEAARHGNKVATDLVMKYGRTRYQIESAGLEHEAKISSPSSTLAVRGTVVSLYDQPPYTPEAISYTGRAQFTYNRNVVPVGQKHGSVTHLIAGADGASQTGVDQTIVDPQSAATRTLADANLIATEVSRGAVLSFDPIANIPVITNGRPLSDSALPSNLPGTLDFVLRWTGNADVNLEVGVDKGDPLANIEAGFKQGEFLYPGFGYQDSASGGHIPFDNRGGPHGGEEFAYWSGAYPTGLYGVAAQSISGKATSFTLDVYVKGTLLNQYYFSADGSSLIKSTQVTRVLPLGQNFTTIVPVPSLPALEAVIPNDPLGSPNPGITSSPATVAALKVKPAPMITKISAVNVKSGKR